MAKLCLKKQSKRIPAARRYKIAKRIRQHNKKKRREDKKKPQAKSNKLITVPSICPFKEDILKEVEEFKKQEKDVIKKAFERSIERKKEAEESQMEAEEEPATLDSLLRNAQSRQAQHDIWGNDDGPVNAVGSKSSRAENSLKAYFKEFRKVVDAADVILEVVDARDPLGTRCLQVEQAVREAPGNKKLVVVLNKADLVPKEVLSKWLLYLRRNVPAIAFKASTQKQKRNLGRRKMKANWSQAETNVSPCVGAEVLMSLLNNYCRNKNIKTSINVGIVGLPNVGKSSIINSLKRSRACNVGSMPGVTRVAQVVELDKKIKLLDSPGIVFASSAKGFKESDASTVLKNAVNVHAIADPIVPATAILHRASKQQMMLLYNIPEYDTPHEFFVSLAECTGRLKKGGIPDTEKAARQLIEDWNNGKIRYFTQPPETKDESHVSASIVTEAVAEFDLDSFKEIEAKCLEQFEGEDSKKALSVPPVVMDSSEPVNALVFSEEHMEDESTLNDEEEEEDVIKAHVVVDAKKKRKVDRGENKIDSKKEKKKDQTLMALEGNQKLNQHKKLSFKKMKKMQARNSRHASSLADVLDNFSLGEKADDDSYDFDTDFTST